MGNLAKSVTTVVTKLCNMEPCKCVAIVFMQDINTWYN